MSCRLRTARISMKPPGGAWTTVATTLAGSNAVAVGDVEITWGQPTPRDQPDPGKIAFTLLVPDNSPAETLLAYDTEVLIEAELDTYYQASNGIGAWTQKIEYYPTYNTWWPLGRGWLTSWTRTTHRRPDGRRAYNITCIDIIGRAAATHLAATPWPNTHTPAQRVAAINAASPSGPLLDPTALNITTEAYDVDNATALDVLGRHCPINILLVETATGIVPLTRPNRNPRYTGNELQFSVAGGVNAITVQADMIEDTGREMDRTSVISEVSVNAYWGTETSRREQTWRAPTAAYSSSRHNVDTDQRLDPTNLQPKVATWANGIIKESRTARRRLPAGHRIRLGLERPNNSLTMLFLLGQRARNLMLKIQGAPPDLDPLQYITGGTLTIHNNTLRLALDTNPAALFGMRPLRYSDLPRTSLRPRIKGTAQTLATLTWKTRITETSAVSFAPWPNATDYT